MITTRQVVAPLLSAVAAATSVFGTQVAMASAGAEATDTATSLKPGQVVTIAGTGEIGYSGDGGDAMYARLDDWPSISVADDGSVYIADTGNNRLRRVDPDGTIDTVAGTRAQRATWRPPLASAPGPDGSQYVATVDDIRRIDPTGEVTVIAGAGEDDVRETGVDGGLAVDAAMYGVEDIDVDDTGNVYVADGNLIRKIDTAGVITTVADGGEVSPHYSEVLEGAGTSAPFSVAADSQGNVYFTLQGFSEVFKVDAGGTLTTVEADFRAQWGRHLAVDAEDNLYLTDGDRVRMVDPDGIISTVGPQLPLDDGQDIAIGPDGNLYFTHDAQVSMLVRSAEPVTDDEASEESGSGESPWADEEPGAVVDVAGVAVDPDPDADSEPVPADPGVVDDNAGPWSLAVDGSGAFYYADTARDVVNKVDSNGEISTIAGTGESDFTGDGGPATEAALSSPRAVIVDDAGTVYIADTGNSRVRMIDPSGVITTIAGITTTAEGPYGDGGPATDAIVGRVSDLALGPDGSLYLAVPGVADLAGHRHGRIRKVDPAGVITTIAGGGDLDAEDSNNAPAIQASLWPGAVDVDAAGNVYFIENGRPGVRMVRTDGILVTIAGDGHIGVDGRGFAGDGGPAVEAELNMPLDVEVGADGTVYIADTFNSRVRAIDPGGIITTIAGTGTLRDTGDDGPATEAGLAEPSEIAVDAEGTLYLTGPRGDAIRAIAADGTISTVVAAEDVAPDEYETGGDTGGNAAVPALEADLGPLIHASLAVGPDGVRIAADHGVDVVADDSIRPLPVSGPGLEEAAAVATTDSGDTYVAVSGEVLRVYPDGDVVTVAGGGSEEGAMEDGQNALTATLSVADLATGPDGTLHIADTEQRRVFTLGEDGTLTIRAELPDLRSMSGIAVGPDGAVYVADDDANRVYAADAEGEVTVVAGTGDGRVNNNDDVGDGGPATEAVVGLPHDVAVDADGTLYVSASNGIRRVSDGTITTVLDSDGGADSPRSLAIGSGGDLYFADTDTQQVRVLVRPGEIAGPFPWAWVAGSVGAVLLVGIAVLVFRRRKAGSVKGTYSGA